MGATSPRSFEFLCGRPSHLRPVVANVCSIKNKKEREGEKRGGDGHSGSRRERERVRERKRHNGSVCRGAGAGADPSEISLWLAKKLRGAAARQH